MLHPRLLLVLLPFVVFSTSGCLYSREIAQTRRDIERQYPELRLEREGMISVGPGTIGFARWITGLVRDDDARFVSHLLANVRRVKVGVYRVEGGSELELDTYDLPKLRRLRGWDTAARVRDEEGLVWILYRENRGRIAQVFVAVLDDKNLVLTRLDGDLEEILEIALAEKGHLWRK